MAPADAMRIQVAAVTRATTVAEALAGAAIAVEALGELAREYTSPEQIASTGLSVYNRHGDDQPVEYEVRHALSVYVAGLDRGGEFVSALGGLDDSVLIESMSPVIGDTTALEVQARELAYADARAKAEELARLAGVELGKVRSVAESGGGGEPRPMAMRVAAMPVEAGSHAVQASLSVTWQID